MYENGRPLTIVQDSGLRALLQVYDPRMPLLTARQLQLEVLGEDGECSLDIYLLGKLYNFVVNTRIKQ